MDCTGTGIPSTVEHADQSSCDGGTILTLPGWSRNVLAEQQLVALNIGTSMSGSALENRSRWHALLGGLLVAVMLACPFVCRAGACCSGDAVESTSGEVDESACRSCQKSRRSPVLPMAPDKPVPDRRCLCAGVMLAEVATAPRQADGTSCRNSTVAVSARWAMSRLRDIEWGQETRAIAGRAICCANGVLNC